MDLQLLAAQLRNPTGDEGRAVGELMNKGNQLINSWAVDALTVKENDNVLELGMGNGAFVPDMLSRHPTINYFGIDYSDTMIEEALRFNKKYIEENRASFVKADAKKVPYRDEFFTKIFSVNTIYFWEEPGAVLTEINRVLKPGGKVAFAIRTKNTMNLMPFTQYNFIKYNLQDLSALVAKHFTITEAFEKIEATYFFNDKPMVLENAIVVGAKR